MIVNVRQHLAQAAHIEPFPAAWAFHEVVGLGLSGAVRKHHGGDSDALDGPPAPQPPRPRGHPRKVKAGTEQSGPPPVILKPIDDNLAPASTYIQDNAAPAKIDKSVLTISEPRRLRD